MKTFQKNVIASFQAAKKDMSALQQSVIALQQQQQTLLSELKKHGITVGTVEPVVQKEVADDEKNFVASKHGDFFHSVDSPFAHKIREDNRLYFPSALAALSQGFKPSSALDI